MPITARLGISWLISPFGGISRRAYEKIFKDFMKSSGKAVIGSFVYVNIVVIPTISRLVMSKGRPRTRLKHPWGWS